MSACRYRVGGYELPNVQASSADADRLTGADVPGLTDAELAAELTRLQLAQAAAITRRCRLTLETCRSPYYVPAVLWITGRIRLVQTELKRRTRARGGGGHERSALR